MSNINNNIDGQLADQLQKLVAEVNDLEERLSKASKAKDRKKLQKLVDEKKALYKSLTESAPTSEEKAPEVKTSEDSKAPEVKTSEDEQAPAPKAKSPKATEEKAPENQTPKAPEAKAPADKTQHTPPKVSAKDTIPTIKLSETAKDKKEEKGSGEPPKWFTGIALSILTVILGVVGWWYFYTDTATVANTVVYERATAQLKEAIKPAWWRWHSWDLEVKGEAIMNWMPAYKAVYVDGGNTSTKGEAMLYAVGCAIRALTKKGMDVGEAAEQVDSMTGPQLKKVLDADSTLSSAEVRAIKRALEN